MRFLFINLTTRTTLLVCGSKCLTFEALKTRTNEQMTKTSKIVKMHWLQPNRMSKNELKIMSVLIKNLVNVHFKIFFKKCPQSLLVWWSRARHSTILVHNTYRQPPPLCSWSTLGSIKRPALWDVRACCGWWDIKKSKMYEDASPLKKLTGN